MCSIARIFANSTLVGCKHRASEGLFYIGGHGFVCQIIEPVTFARLYLHCGILHWADI